VNKPALLSGVIHSDRLGPPQGGEEESLNFREEKEGAGDIEEVSIFLSSQKA